MDRKTNSIQIRVTEEEKMLIQCKAMQEGKFVSEMIIEAVLGQRGVNNGGKTKNLQTQ